MTEDENQSADEQRAVLDLARLNAAYHTVFDTPSGEEVLRHLVGISVTTLSHVPGDPYTTAFNEGRRHLVLSILRQLNRDAFDIIRARQRNHESTTQY